MIQEITKHVIPMIVELTFPDYKKYIPSLNSIIMEPIDMIAHDLSVDYIYVHPIGKQGDILEKHYGFHKTQCSAHIPCTLMAGTSKTEETPCYFKIVKL